MKKLLSICIAAIISGSACNAQQKYLKELISDNNQRYLYFSYDKSRIDSIYEEQPDGYSAFRLFKYDAAGNNTIQERYQMPKEATDYLYTDNVYFTYDENNRVIMRKNYNLDIYGGTNNFILGGVYTYEYNAEGKISKRSLYWDEELTRLYEVITYEYDIEGRLISETRKAEQFGQYIEDFKQEYEYDSMGRLVKTDIYGLDYTTYQLALSNFITYKYDENGNMTEETAMVADGTVTEQHEYKYDSPIKTSETIYPSHFDDNNKLYTCSNNVVTEDVIYMRDIKAGEMIYIDTEKWVYGDNDFAGIDNVKSDKVMSLLSLTSDMVILGNVSEGSDVRVYSENGNMVSNGAYGNGINISMLPKGIYMIVTDGSCIKVRK